jgi:hypothetical protein
LGSAKVNWPSAPQANNYTVVGVTSDASGKAQGSPTHLVTSNAKGDLAAYTFSQLGIATPGKKIKGANRRTGSLQKGSPNSWPRWSPRRVATAG